VRTLTHREHASHHELYDRLVAEPGSEPVCWPASRGSRGEGGYAGKCLDDARNSSAKGAKAEIWTCNAADKAQLWTYSNGELVHNGRCLDDPAYSTRNGTRLIVYTCKDSANQRWQQP
jgi:Ricin-type beta-trefoil lectin domain